MALPIRRGVAVPARREAPRGVWWDPFQEFDELWGRMGRLLEQAVETGAEEAPWVPAVEANETNDAYLVKAELPGAKRDNIKVDVQEGELTISGEVKEEDKGEALRRRMGKFYYRTRVPNDADTEAVEATLHDGVLTVRIPKSEKAQPRRIEIAAEESPQQVGGGQRRRN